MRVEPREYLRAHRPVRVGLAGDRHRTPGGAPRCQRELTITRKQLGLESAGIFSLQVGIAFVRRECAAGPTPVVFPLLPEYPHALCDDGARYAEAAVQGQSRGEESGRATTGKEPVG